MKPQRMRLRAREKDLERRNAQFEKLTRGYTPHPQGMRTRNRHKQVPNARKAS